MQTPVAALGERDERRCAAQKYAVAEMERRDETDDLVGRVGGEEGGVKHRAPFDKK